MDLRHKKIIKSACSILVKSLGPSKIILFGSRAKGSHGRHSDFDFALDCKKPSISTQRRINDEIDKVSGLYKVDIIYLDSVNKEFKDIILKTGKVIYESRRN